MFLYLTISSASLALPYLFCTYFIIISWTSWCNTSCTYFVKREFFFFSLFPVLVLKIKTCLNCRVYLDLSLHVTENTDSLHYKDQSHTCANVFLWNMYYFVWFWKKCDVLIFLLRIQNTKFCKNSSVDIQVLSCGLMEVCRKTTRLVVSIRSPNGAINYLSNSNKKQEQFNILNFLYCDRAYQEGITEWREMSDHVFVSVHICSLQSETFELQFDRQNKLSEQWNDNFLVVNHLSNSNFNLQFISAFTSTCLRTSRYVDKRLQFPTLLEQYEGIKNERN